MKKVIILCVIYNKKINTSSTINTFNDICQLTDFSNITPELHVWDNSTCKDIKEFNSKYCEEHKVSISSNGRNEKLGTIYNKFIEIYSSDYLCIFDDDSVITNSYVNSIDSAVKIDGVKVGIPKVMSQFNSLYSPAKLGVVRGKLLDDISSGFHSGITAITSGVFLDCAFVISNGLKFDEELNLYGIDTLFFINICKKNIPIFVFDVEMQHDLSIYNDEPKSIKAMRFDNLRKSNLYVARKRGGAHFAISGIYWLIVSLIKKVS